MKEHKLYRKIRSRTVLVFFVCLIGIGGAAYHICQLSAQTQKEQARYTARAASRRIEAQINKYLVVADILKKLVEDGYEIGPDEFQNMSKFMMDDGGVIEGIEYATDGIVEEVYPEETNRAAIGLNFFEREEGEEVAGIEGTGLGLPIGKRLVDMLDGEITCHSKKGEGTSYTLRFVLEEAEKEDTCTQDSGIETDRASAEFEGIHALLVEDNELNREIALYMLREMKFRTDTAENGARAVEKVKASLEDPYDIIFMDVQMPVMNGHIAKPVEIQKLVEAVRQVLQ